MKRIVWCVTLFALMMLAGCGSAADTGTVSVPQETEQENSEEEISMRMFIGDTEVAVVWEDNDAVETLREMTAQGGVAIAVGDDDEKAPLLSIRSYGSGRTLAFAGRLLVLVLLSLSWNHSACDEQRR